MKGIEAKNYTKARPYSKILPATGRTLRYSTKSGDRIDSLTELRVISPKQYSEWATPVVPVIKKDGSVRLCVDFKVTLNPAICVDHYPIPRIEDLFASLAGGKLFSKLDLPSAYLQMPVALESRKLQFPLKKGYFAITVCPSGSPRPLHYFRKQWIKLSWGFQTLTAI